MSDSILAGLTSIYKEDEEDSTILQQDVKALFNYIYLRSPFLQAKFNYNLNYLRYSSYGRKEIENVCLIDENGYKTNRTTIQGMDVVQLISNQEKIQPDKRHIAILISGMFESIEIFTAGGRRSLAGGLLEHGCEVWVVQLQLPLSCPDRSREEPPMAGYSPSSLLALVNYISSRGLHLVSSVSWIAHSSGCGQLLSSLQPPPSQRTTAEESALVRKLLHLTTNIILLSPLLWSAPSLSQRDAALGRLPAVGLLPATAHAGRTLLLHEVLLHNPSTVYAIFGASHRKEVLLESLQSWRDVLSERAYCDWLVAPIARLALGWRFRNIAADRRTALLPHLFAPASSRAVMAAVEVIRSSETHVARCAGYGSSLSCSLRWCLNYTALAVEAALRMLQWLLLLRPRKTGRSSDAVLPTQHIQLPPTARIPATGGGVCRVLVFAGGADALIDWQVLEGGVRGLPCAVHVVPGYEHLDPLWADSAPERVFRLIYDSISTSSSGSTGSGGSTSTRILL